MTDLEFVLKELHRINEEDPILKGTLDLEHIATMGWSFGGGVAGEFARTEPRVKATVFLDAYFQEADTLLSLGLQKPLLYQASGDARGDQRLFNKATQDAFFMLIDKTRHADFGDPLWIDRTDETSRRSGLAMDACVLSFLKKYLKGEDDRLLENPSAQYPQVTRFQKK